MNRESKRHRAREERRQEAASTPAAPSATSEDTGRRRTSPAQFLREVRTELKKVAWPNRQEVISYTVVVLTVTTVLTALVWAMDWVFARAVLNLFE